MGKAQFGEIPISIVADLDLQRRLWRLRTVCVYPLLVLRIGMQQIALGGLAFHLWRGWRDRLGGNRNQWLILWGILLVSRERRQHMTVTGIALVLRDMYAAVRSVCAQKATVIMSERVLEFKLPLNEEKRSF